MPLGFSLESEFPKRLLKLILAKNSLGEQLGDNHKVQQLGDNRKVQQFGDNHKFQLSRKRSKTNGFLGKTNYC